MNILTFFIRNSKSELEKENREIQKMLSEERHQAKETAERAKAMLKVNNNARVFFY